MELGGGSASQWARWPQHDADDSCPCSTAVVDVVTPGLSYMMCTVTTWCVQVLRSPKEAFAAAMQSWRVRWEKCVCLEGDYFEKWLHFQLPVVISFFLNKLGDLTTWTHHVTRRSAFFELSHTRTHIFQVHNAITACLTHLPMNFDWFHATKVEESNNQALFFECKRRHFSIKNTTATRPRHKHSTGSTVLPLGLA